MLAKIAAMAEPDRTTATRIHELVKEIYPDIMPKTWYGSPAYYKDGKVVLFFQDAGKFKTRYATLGFSEDANLDDGNMWPSSFAVVRLGAAEEKVVAELIRRAVS